ncbi:hypothetical protein ACFFG4_32345 [Micromonospora costi]
MTIALLRRMPFAAFALHPYRHRLRCVATRERAGFVHELDVQVR